MSPAERLAEVKGRIAAAARDAGRDASQVRLLAVSKRQPDESLRAVFEAGQDDFGENYVQELVRKQALLPQARFHMIGHVQTNKAKGAAGAAMVHTLDSARLAKALAKAVPEGRRLEVLVEVNVGGEDQKAGVAPDGVEQLLEVIRTHPELEARGLMCIPPVDAGRAAFATLRGLAERLRASTGLALPELSMGMSADFEDAIREGSTVVRVGTAVFGPRLSR